MPIRAVGWSLGNVGSRLARLLSSAGAARCQRSSPGRFAGVRLFSVEPACRPIRSAR
ncbi:hypothetical protein BURPSS13_C0012 [Burkholderia pseudomallei S13]|nr:hypothetical protein BURPSS13_C0012 [Burkholderia pseudomallei S13]